MIKEKLTPHFSYEEMCKTSTGVSNPLTTEAKINLLYLCRKLETVRSIVGYPLIITSAYRCAKVNKLVGGVSNSLHLTGRACDIAINHLSKSDADFLYETLEDTYPTELLRYDSRGYIHYAI